MATDQQRKANRENARRSTGPRTPAGKARSAANRTTHALTGRHAILPTETPADFDNLLARLSEEWDPQTETESQQVELIAQQWWRLLRIARLETAAFTVPLEIRHRLALTDEVERISRYEVRIRRAYHQAIETLRRLQSGRRPSDRPPRQTRGVNSNPIAAAPPPAADSPERLPVDPGPAHVPVLERELSLIAARQPDMNPQIPALHAMEPVQRRILARSPGGV